MSLNSSFGVEDDAGVESPASPRGLQLNCITLASIPSARSIPTSSTFCLSPSLTSLSQMTLGGVVGSPRAWNGISKMDLPEIPSLPQPPPLPLSYPSNSSSNMNNNNMNNTSNLGYYNNMPPSPFLKATSNQNIHNTSFPNPSMKSPSITPNITPQMLSRLPSLDPIHVADLTPQHITAHTSIPGYSNNTLPITPLPQPYVSNNLPYNAYLGSPLPYVQSTSMPASILCSQKTSLQERSVSTNDVRSPTPQRQHKQNMSISEPMLQTNPPNPLTSILEQGTPPPSLPYVDTTPISNNSSNHQNTSSSRAISSSSKLKTKKTTKTKHTQSTVSTPTTNTSVQSEQISSYISATPPQRDFHLVSTFTRLQDTEEPCQKWSEGEFHRFLLRGKQYMKDKKKLAALQPILETIGVVIIRSTVFMHNQCESQPELKAYLNEQSAHYEFFCNFVWVLPPTDGYYYHVMHQCGRKPGSRGEDPVFDHQFDTWVCSGDVYRKERTKFICSIETAPWLIRVSMESLAANKPALIGKQQTCDHYTGANYVEVNIDVSSSKIASMLNGIVYSNAPKLKLDLGFLIEGREARELPERLITCMKFIHVDPQEVYYTYEEKRTDTEREIIKQRYLDQSKMYRKEYAQKYQVTSIHD